MKRTKIICTLGPASSDPAVLEKMIRNGMNIARLNFSHGSYEEHAKRVSLVRETAHKIGTHVGILADLQGPKIRIGTLGQEPMILKEGQRLVLTINSARQRESGVVFVDYPTLVQDVTVGGQIYLADGLIGLKVNSCTKDSLDCEVLNEGELTSHKGVTLPGVSVNLPALTQKDRLDLEFVIRSQVDFIAISFARRADHLAEIRDLVTKQGGKQLLIAKIENQEGVKNSPEIIKECDGIMVARGDLGTEVPLEEVPLIQRYLVELSNTAGKPVITATEMLESMIRNPRPTRAEITDIAHAILDGTDAIMLSAETAVGKYPATAVEMMSRVAQKIEDSLKYEEILAKKKVAAAPTIADAISMHESTVSRVTANKYMATSRGIFELKYFFTSAIASADGGEAHSAEAVRHRIRQLIDAETPADVLSDDTIVEKLRGAGIDIARRTVAKYREAMRIPSSVQRRREKQAASASA
jgi:pyruvate kinase